MKKYCLLLILLVITTFHLLAQRSRDVLYLKDGGIINGTIIEISDNQYKIRTIDGSVFVFKSEDVDKYMKQIPPPDERKKQGMGFAMEGGFMIGPPDSEHPFPFSFNLIANYTIKTKNIFGIGSGADFLSESYTPLYAEYKYIASGRNTAPFFFLRAGKLFYLSSGKETTDINQPQYNTPINRHGGFTMAAGTGISWNHGANENYLSFAFRYAQTSYQEENYQHYPADFFNNYYRLEVKFGFKF